MEMDITQADGLSSFLRRHTIIDMLLAYYMTGSSLSITANRISYVFDLLGQSLPVDTACSSSLTAMHLAVQAIRRGEIDQAVVAGVNVILTPLETASFSQLGVMSPDGISKSFDDEANGYARGDVGTYSVSLSKPAGLTLGLTMIIGSIRDCHQTPRSRGEGL